MDRSEPTLRDLFLMAKGKPHFRLGLEFMIVRDYAGWVALVNQAIDMILTRIAENPELRSKRSEDDLTIEIVGLLKMLPIDADHETKIGGHVDIKIRGGDNDYLWLGEAKWDRDNSWLYQGFEQLTERYSTGSLNQNHGGLIIYVGRPRADEILIKWRKYLEGKVPGIQLSECPKSPLAFLSIHDHKRTGVPYVARHTAVSLYWHKAQ